MFNTSIVWQWFGTLLGWVASMTMLPHGWQGTAVNMLVGIVGAFVGGLIFSMIGFGSATIPSTYVNPSSFLIPFMGVAAFLGMMNMHHHAYVHQI